MSEKKQVQLWLDDLRVAPDGWLWVKTVPEAKAAFQDFEVVAASLDNDLGEGLLEGRDLVYWMCENDIWPARHLSLHSANPVAVDYMSSMVARYGPYNQLSPDRRTFNCN